MARQYTTDKGTQVMLGMLLSQYRNSPILKSYMLAFVEEMDELYTEIERVYFGRLFEDAEGEQLDIIGRIVDQSRNVNIAKQQFGFANEPSSLGFGNINDLSEGGDFRAEADKGFDVAPMDDDTYKRMLRARFLLLNNKTPSIETAYEVIINLLGVVPSVFSLAEVGSNSVTLTLSASTAGSDVVLINYMATWFIKAGCQFTINLI